MIFYIIFFQCHPVLYSILLVFFLVPSYLKFFRYPSALNNPTNFEKKNAFHFSFNAFSLIIFLRWWAKKRERGKKIYLDCNESNLALTSKQESKPNHLSNHQRNQTTRHPTDGRSNITGKVSCAVTFVALPLEPSPPPLARKTLHFILKQSVPQYGCHCHKSFESRNNSSRNFYVVVVDVAVE